MAQYLPVFALLVLAGLFAALSFVASKLLAPRNPTVEKLAPYECGITPGRDLPERFPVRFYLIAMLFVIFDIEIVFLYPWAVNYAALGLFGLVAVLIFSALVFESFVYLISKGALEWGPLQVSRRQDPMRGVERTTTSTVRRVGTDGRVAVAVGVDELASDTEQEAAA
ncbi:MAG: NADH-quinone oxidoreductase subunit A [Acidimicrobiales bacterium]